MTISKLIWYLIKYWFKYGNCKIDIITEDHIGQTEQELASIAYSSREKRVKLLPKGF